MNPDSLIVSALMDTLKRRHANGQLYTAREVLAVLRGAADIHDPAIAAKIGAYLDESRAASL